jgi:hypothetical protein
MLSVWTLPESELICLANAMNICSERNQIKKRMLPALQSKKLLQKQFEERKSINSSNLTVRNDYTLIVCRLNCHLQAKGVLYVSGFCKSCLIIS